MNPMTNVKNIKKLSEQDIRLGGKSSWHDQYKDSAWIFVGGLPYDLTEGDVICVFSQYGEIVNINLVRDKDTGKQKGFCFICYEDQRSTNLAVDNLNAIKILGRTLRVDHVENYKVPKEGKNLDEETRLLREHGCAPVPKVLQPLPNPVELPKSNIDTVVGGVRLPPRLPINLIKEENTPEVKISKKKSKVKEISKKKSNKNNKKEKKSRKRKQSSSSSSTSSSDSSSSDSESSSSDDNRKHKKKKRH